MYRMNFLSNFLTLYLDSHPLPPHCFLLQFHNLFYILRYLFKIPSDFYENGKKINCIFLPPSPYFYWQEDENLKINVVALWN